jgi:probable HAF family extracellular repeat protein
MVRLASMRLVSVAVGIGATVLTVGIASAGPVLFSVMELGTVGGDSVTVVALNNRGQVVGSGMNPGALRGFRTMPNRPIDSAAVLLDGPEENMALGLNDLGQAVGMLDAFPFYTFRTAPDAPVNRGADNIIPASEPQAWPHDIDNAGRVVGEILFGDVSGPRHAFRTGAGAMFDPATDDLGTFGGAVSFASALNDAGVTVGTATHADGRSHAFRVPLGRAIDAALDDLGTLGGDTSSAADVNDSGQVVGAAETAVGVSHAFRTSPGAPIGADDDLGVLPGMTFSGAGGINGRGDVVGSSSDASGAFRAFLFTDGRLYDLNDLLAPGAGGALLTSAVDINDRGQVLAYALLDGGTRRAAVLLTPTAIAIPLPPALPAGTIGLAGVALAARALGRGRRSQSTGA